MLSLESIRAEQTAVGERNNHPPDAVLGVVNKRKVQFNQQSPGLKAGSQRCVPAEITCSYMSYMCLRSQSNLAFAADYSCST